MTDERFATGGMCVSNIITFPTKYDLGTPKNPWITLDKVIHGLHIRGTCSREEMAGQTILCSQVSGGPGGPGRIKDLTPWGFYAGSCFFLSHMQVFVCLSKLWPRIPRVSCLYWIWNFHDLLTWKVVRNVTCAPCETFACTTDQTSGVSCVAWWSGHCDFSSTLCWKDGIIGSHHVFFF